MFRGTSCAEAASLKTLIVSIKAEPPFQSDSIKILPTHLKDAATKREIAISDARTNCDKT